MSHETKKGAGQRKSLWRRYREYSRDCLTSGFIPTYDPRWERFGKRVARTWARIQVGEINVVGRENLEACKYAIYCPNNSSMLDAIIMYSIMPEGIRYMCAVEEMRGLFGLKAMIMGAMGCYAVDRKNGKTVIAPSIGILKSGMRITMFPEGKISPTGEYLEFKKGAAWIAMGTCDELGHQEMVALIPIHICYNRRDVASAGDFLKMGLRWRHDVTVTIGKPIYLHEVAPLTAENLIGKLRDAITSNTCPTTSVKDEETAGEQS